MKIAVIAANGRSGQAFVAAALDAGHEVRAGVHGRALLPAHENLAVVQCDATKSEELRKLVVGTDAVVSLIGHVKGSPKDVQTRAMVTLTHVMNEIGIRRLVSLTGTGVRFAGDKITFVDSVLNLGIQIVDPARVRDGKEHVNVLQKSNLDWTVIRVLKLQDVAPRPFSLQEHGPTKPYVGRAEVAQAILEVLQNNSYIKQAPIISKI